MARAPLTNDELERMKSKDFVRLKLTDDEKLRLRSINLAREEEGVRRIARMKIEQAPLLAELQSLGLDIQSVSDLINTLEIYSTAIPTLLKHLVIPYSDVTKEAIARALARPEPEVQKAWPLLVEEYRNAPMGYGIKGPGDTKELRLASKDGLACALSVAVTDETLPELIAIAKDRNQGESRVLLLSALKSRCNKSLLAKHAIDQLARDPQLEKEIISWRK